MAIDAVAHTAFMFSPAVLVAFTLTSAIAIFIRRRNQTNKSASVKTKEILARFHAHPDVHIANTEEVERKLSALISGGAAKLAVTADCVECTEGQFNSQSNHQLADCTVWAKCDTADNKQFQLRKPTATNDRTCGSNVRCDSKTQFETQAPTAMRKRICQALTTCLRGQYVSKQHTYSSDRVCSTCDGETEFQPLENADVCDEMSVCGPGDRVSKPGNAYTDLNCAPCAKLEYREEEEHRFNECIVQPSCGAGEFISTPTATTRQTCELCSEGTYQAKPKHQSETCVRYKVATCDRDQMMENAGSVLMDQSCRSCPEGQWQWRESHTAEACIPLTTPTTSATTTPTTTTSATTTATSSATTTPTTSATTSATTSPTTTPTTTPTVTATTTQTTTDTTTSSTSTTILNITLEDLIDPVLMAEVSESDLLELAQMDEEEIILWVGKKNLQKEEKELETQIELETEMAASAAAAQQQKKKSSSWAAFAVIFVLIILVLIAAAVLYRRHEHNIQILKAAPPIIQFVHGNASTGGTTESEADGGNDGVLKSLYGSLRGAKSGSKKSEQLHRPSSMMNMTYAGLSGLPDGDNAGNDSTDDGVALRKLSHSTGLNMVNPTYDSFAATGGENTYDSGFGLQAADGEVAYGEVPQNYNGNGEESAYMDTSPNPGGYGGGGQESAYMDTAPTPEVDSALESAYLDTAPRPDDESAYLDTAPRPDDESAGPVTMLGQPAAAPQTDSFGGFGEGGGYDSDGAAEV